MNNCNLSNLNITPFVPLPLFTGGLAQTIIPHFIPPGKKPPTNKFHLITLSDGDKLVLTESRPKTWTNGNRIIVLIHGLAGCEDSNYLIRLGRKLFQQGNLVLRMNLRSCGPGRGYARQPYHSGRSEDTLQVLQYLQKQFPLSPVTQIGFSLSANITLKMVGENQFSQENTNLDSCVAVSPPLDLEISAHKIVNLSYKIFNYYFINKLKKNVMEVLSDFPELPPLTFKRGINLMDFDDLYVAPRSGFSSGLDYYRKSSSKNFIANIKIPTLIIYAKDDPVVDTSDINSIQLPDCIDTIYSNQGGHVGFLAAKGYWSDSVILAWLNKKFL